jgi:hypothetical protein
VVFEIRRESRARPSATTRLPPEIENPYLLRCDDGTGMIPLNPGLRNRAGEPLIPFEPRVPSADRPQHCVRQLKQLEWLEALTSTFISSLNQLTQLNALHVVRALLRRAGGNNATRQFDRHARGPGGAFDATRLKCLDCKQVVCTAPRHFPKRANARSAQIPVDTPFCQQRRQTPTPPNARERGL